MVVGFVFGGGGVGGIWGDSAVEAAVVEPVDVFEGGEGGVVKVSPWSPVADQFSFVETDGGLC